MESFTAPSRSVKNVQFGLFSPEEIRSMSVTSEGIQFPMTMASGCQVNGGLMDPRQGPLDRHSRCRTCAGDMTDCPGHFGHIELVKPIFHAGFLPKVVKVLRCICFYCSKLLIAKNDPRLQSLTRASSMQFTVRFAHVFNVCKNIQVCEVDLDGDSGCGRYQPSIKREGLEVIAIWKHEKVQANRQTFTAERIREILSNVSDEDCEFMGFNLRFGRPDWMILTVLPVPPPCVRPAVMSGTKKSHDDLTYKLADILKANITLRGYLRRGANDQLIQANIKLLQFYVASYMDDSLPKGIPLSIHLSGKPLKSISSRIRGKDGRIRGNLMGKRVDFCARTVITADPNLGIDQVGVPLSIAKNLTYPELVTPFNIDQMQRLVARGHSQYPGANYIIRSNGDRIDLRFCPKPSDLHLEYGYKVERHLQDGDLVVFNRQPSLHKMSMMGHRVKVLPWSTFRLNLSCTSPYNADFDGDEMNLHVPQSVETRAEVENIHLASRQIITPQSNRPIMGIVQDSLLGAMKFTQRDTFIDRELLMNLLMLLPEWNGVIPQACILKPTLLWSGKQIFSLIIPESVNLHRTTDGDSTTDELRWINPTDSIIIIEKGSLVAGRLCRRTLGAQAGSLFHICFLELGHRVTGELYRNIQVVVNHWLMIEGHSVGIADTVADFATFQQIQAKIQEAKNKVVQVIQAAHNMELEPTPGSTLRQTFENLVNQILNNAREQTGSLALKSLTHFNNFKSMAIAGSKGSTINISQIIACVGQQNVEGKRISNGFTGRSLPHFLQGDCSAEARGFVENSYLAGLTPSEFFFHAMGGREGLIDTAVKTAETGYIQRRLIKAMETLMVNYDGTVRNSMNQLIQIRYGEDGLCGERVEFHDVNFKASQDAFQLRHKLQTPLDSNIFTEESLEQISRSADVWETLDAEWNRLQEDRRALRELFPTGHVETALPCNFHQIIQNAKKIFHITQNQRTNLTPVKITTDVENLLSRCLPSGKADNLLFRFFVRSHLSSQLVLREHSLSSEAFDWVIGEIETRFQQAQINPGEMVGAIAAQSLGEPATQMTLNTFHFAGVSSKNVTLGVPRLNEIINVSRKPKAPSLVMFLHSVVAQDAEKAKAVANRIEHTTLRNLTQSASIHFDPDLTKTIIKEDQEFLDAYVSMPDFNKERVSPWLLRFELDRKKMENKKLTLEFIAEKISQAFGEDLICMFSDNNSRKLVLRVHLLQNDCDKFKEDDKERMQDDVFLRYLEVNLLSNMTLLGIESIKKVYMHLPNTVDKKRHYITAAGEVKMKSEWLLESSGTALLPVLNDADVDATRSYSNDLCEIFQVLGIEAARKSIQREINAVLQFYGLYVNYRHLALLSEVMTANGHLMAITRHGINQQSCGPLLKCSFEQSINALLEAAVFSEIDSLRGVSESILLGQLPQIGTGSFDLILDAQKCLSENAVGCFKTCLTSNELRTPWHLYGADYTSLSPADSIRRSYPCEAGLSPNNREGSWTSKSTTHERSQNTAIVQLHRHQPYELHQSLIEYSPVPTNNFSYTTPYANRNKKTSPVSLPHPLCSPLSPIFSPTLSISSPSSFLLSENSNVVEGDRETPLSQSAIHFPYSNLDSYSYLEPTQYTPKSSEYSIKSSHSSQWMSNRVINSNSFSSTCHIYSRNAHSKKFTKYYSTNTSSISREHIIKSPNYSPSSPNYTPNSPKYSPSLLNYSPSSPNYTPSSSNYTPSSPNHSPSSPNYSESSSMQALKLPNYSSLALRSPSYSPTSPIYSLSSPAYSPSSPAYSPTSPIYRTIFSDISKKHSSQLPDHSSNTASYSPHYSPTSPYFTDESQSLTNYSPSLSKYSPTSQNSLVAGQHYSSTSSIYSLDTSQHSLTSSVSPDYSPNLSIHSSYSPSALNFSPCSSNSISFAVGSPTYSPSSPSYSPASSEFSVSARSFSPSP